MTGNDRPTIWERHSDFRSIVDHSKLSKPALRPTWHKPVGERSPLEAGDSLPHEGFWMTLAHGSSAQCPWGVSASISCGVDPQISTAPFAGAIKLFVQEPLPQIQQDHPDVEVQQWSVQIDHIHMVLVRPPNQAVSSSVGKMKANVSRQLRLRYSELKRTYWGAGLWSSGFFSSTVGLNEAVIRRYVDHQEQVARGQIQLEFEFSCHAA